MHTIRKRIGISLGALLALAIVLELFLRFYLGFCDTVLIREDPDYEYIAAPSQNRFRFRNHIMYNKESMRSSEIDNTAVKVLVFGDSVINGGTLTDQDSLATSILTDTLSRYYRHKVQFLNISAGSWGPDNGYAYLQKHGDFGAKQIILFVSSHDAYDNMNFEKIVGVNESFPDKQSPFALYELVQRYLLPRLGLVRTEGSTDKLGISKKKEGSEFNTGFASFAAYSRTHNIPLVIYLHAEVSELKSGQYNKQGQEIIRFAAEHQIPLIQDLQGGLQASDFRDNIHLNDQGQKIIASDIIRFFKANSL